MAEVHGVGVAAPGADTTGAHTESVTVFFPVYNDEATVRRVTEKALTVCAELTDVFEVIIIDDGSPDASGVIADELAHEHEQVAVVHHPTEPWLRRRGADADSPRAGTNGSASPTATTSTTCVTCASCGGCATATT